MESKQSQCSAHWPCRSDQWANTSKLRHSANLSPAFLQLVLFADHSVFNRWHPPDSCVFVKHSYSVAMAATEGNLKVLEEAHTYAHEAQVVDLFQVSWLPAMLWHDSSGPGVSGQPGHPSVLKPRYFTVLSHTSQYLTAVLILNQPADPMAAVLAEIESCKAAVAETGSLPAVESQARPTEESAKQYIDEHNLPQLFEELCAAALYAKPDDAFSFISSELQRVMKAKGAGGQQAPTFFTEDDLMGMFTLFDPTGRGVISQAQVETGLRNLGLKQVTLTAAEAGAASAQGFSAKQFTTLAMARLTAEKLV